MMQSFQDEIYYLKQDLEHKKIAIRSRKAKIKELESQIEKMKLCEICEYGMNICSYCYSPELCKNKDKWKLHHRLSEIGEYSK